MERGSDHWFGTPKLGPERCVEPWAMAFEPVVHTTPFIITRIFTDNWRVAQGKANDTSEPMRE